MEYSYKGGSIEVAVERKLSIGSILNIHPSLSYLGIESGVVKIVGMVSEISYDDITPDMEAWLDGMGYSGDDDDIRECNMQDVERVVDEPWIQYAYLRKYDSPSRGDTYWMPLQEFLQHTTIY